MSTNTTKRRLDDELQSKNELLQELQVQHIELEMQNRQLREAQQELEETRDRYADLYDFAPVGYLTLDESGVVQEINLTGAVMLGRERINIVGQSFLSFISVTSVHSFLSHLRQVFSREGNIIMEVMIRSKENKPRIFSLESLAVAGEKRICRTVMTDVTEQRRMAISLQVNRSAQDALLNSIPALVFYLDNNLRFLNVSQAFAEFVGFTPECVVGKTFFDLFPNMVAEDFHQVSSSVLSSGIALYGFENTLPDVHGNAYCMSSVLAPFRDLLGKIIGLVGVSIDISMIKSTSNSNRDLLVQNRKLTRNLFTAQEEERRHLARELHDELGQWLTAIQAEAQVICNIANNQAPKIHDSALAINKSAAKVHEVIRSMMRHLRPSLLDELGLKESLLELQRQWCNSHPDIVCKFELDVSLGQLGDELNIVVYRVVQETLNNIASHAHARRVVVSLELEPAKDGGTDFLSLSVQDDGSGFDSKQVRAGIGLLGMRERVIAAGGDFSIDSTWGNGTIVQARLPLHKIL